MFWLDIEDANGVKVGDGPLRCLVWEHTPRLSRAGTWRAEVPIGDSKLQYATHKRRVRCYEATPFGVFEIGAGIIDSKLTRITRGGTTIELSGDDLLGELGYRLVHNLQLQEVATYVPRCAWSLLVLGSHEFVWWDGDDVSPEIFVEDQDSYIYILLPNTTFNEIVFTMTWDNVVTTGLNMGVSDERGGDLYRQPDDLVDTTIQAGAPLGQNGSMTFTRPASWFVREIGEVGATETGYVVRLDPEDDLFANVGLEQGIKFTSIIVKSYTAIAEDLQPILDFAPDGWEFAPSPYYDATVNGTLGVIDGESVLAALVAQGERTGEQFRLGSGRQVEWLGFDQPDSGIVALQAVGDWVNDIGEETEAYRPPDAETFYLLSGSDILTDESGNRITVEGA